MSLIAISIFTVGAAVMGAIASGLIKKAKDLDLIVDQSPTASTGKAEGAGNADARQTELEQANITAQVRTEEALRAQARQQCQNILAKVLLTIKNDDILARWKLGESEALRKEAEDFLAKITMQTPVELQAKSQDLVGRLKLLRDQAYTLETQKLAQKAIVARVSDALAEVGFDVFAEEENAMSLNQEKVITARKKNGESFSMVIALDGTAICDFDGYQNQTCKAEMEQITEILVTKYGVEQTPKELLLKNDPVQIGSTARPLPNKQFKSL